MAYVLTQETFDAFTELLNALYIGLLHAEGFACEFRFGLQGWNFGCDAIVPGYVGHEVFNEREGAHGADGNNAGGKLVYACFAHQAWFSIYFGAAGAAFCRLTVPATG